jgi:dTDP-glucose 4,6-dehydratase
VEKLIPKSVKYLSVGRKIDLHNKGTPVRTWLHAEDTARAVITVIEAEITNEIFNISGNYEEKNIEVVKKIIKLVNGDTEIEKYLTDMIRPGQDLRYSIDDTKLKKLGWSANADFDKELEKVVEYYKNNFIW